MRFRVTANAVNVVEQASSPALPAATLRADGVPQRPEGLAALPVTRTRTHRRGDVIDLTAEQAKRYIALGAVEAAA